MKTPEQIATEVHDDWAAAAEWESGEMLRLTHDQLRNMMREAIEADRTQRQTYEIEPEVLNDFSDVVPGDTIRLTRGINFAPWEQVSFIAEKGSVTGETLAGPRGGFHRVDMWDRIERLKRAHVAMPSTPGIYWLEYGTLVHYALDFNNMWTKIIPMKPYGVTQSKPEPVTQEQIRDEVQALVDTGTLKLRIQFGGEGLKPILREVGQLDWAEWDTTHRQV